MPSRAPASASVPTVHRTTRSSGQVALYTSAAGSSELRPAAKSSAESSASIPELRKMTIVEPLSAMVRMPSPAGMGVRPESRVITTDWLIPGSVYSWRSAAAAPQKLDTPGTTS